MRIIYMGTPDFAVPALESIVRLGWDVPLVVTKPDRPAHRGHRMQQCAVKEKAIELGLQTLSPDKIRKNDAFLAELKAADPDFIVVAAYGKILPKDILDLPRCGCINIHGSLLPKYRGAAPIQRAVLNGDAVSGVTIMAMAEECDAGDIYMQKEISIEGKTAEDVFEDLSALGAQLLCECLPNIFSGKLKSVPQDASLATFAPMIAKEEGLLDWTRGAKALEAHVRGMYSWPIAFTHLHGEVLKVHAAQASESRTDAPPGTVVETGKSGIGVACGDARVLLLKTVQLPGKKAMDAAAFQRGHAVEIGTFLL